MKAGRRSGGEGGKRAGHRGELEGNRKTIARGMPGDPGVTVVTNARAFYPTRAAAGASSARHSLRPLIGGREISAKLARKRAARSRSCVPPSLRGAERPSNPFFLF